MRKLAKWIRKATSMARGGDKADPLTAAFNLEYFALQLSAATISCHMVDLVSFYKCKAEARVLSPNPWFDEDFYRRRNPDVLSAINTGTVLSGFDHFVHHGIREGRVPNLAFEHQIAGRAHGELAGAGQFDANSYLLENELARLFLRALPLLTPLEFFNLYGRRMGHPLQGDIEQRDGHACVTRRRQGPSDNRDLVCSEFDAEYYQKKYQDEIGDMSPLAHYLSAGRTKGYSPNAAFDEMFYRAFYADINRAVADGQCASGFEHYLLAGRKEGRMPRFDLRRCLEQVLPGVTQPVALTKVVELEQKLTPHSHTLIAGQPRRVWFFIPRLNPDIFFGGYAALIHLAEAFMRRGFPIGFFLFEDVTESFEYFCHRSPCSELAKRRDEIALFSTFDKEPFPLGFNDVLIAYSAWQALLAGDYAEHLACKNFGFLVQEHEAVFHSYDSMRFLVDSAYKRPHVAIFNSAILEKFFRQQRLGIFENDSRAKSFVTFEHVLTPIVPPGPRVLRERKTRRLIVYARPESHAARNLTEICLIALRKAIARNIFCQEFEFIGIGALSGPHVFDLGLGRTLEIRPKMDKEAYAELLQGADIGLSLMYAPHPSLIPFELANAGAIVVTNTFSNRSSADIRMRSPRMVPVELTIDAIVDGLQEAVSMLDDIELRTNPAHAIQSPGSWQEVFNDAFFDNLLGKLLPRERELDRKERRPHRVTPA